MAPRARFSLTRWLGPLAALATLAGCGSAQHVSPDGTAAYEVSLATFEDHMALAWHGGSLAHSAIWLQLIDPQGKPVGAVRQLTDARREAYEPDLESSGTQLVLAWYEKEAGTGALSAWLSCLDASGREIWRRPLSVAGRNGRNPLVRVTGHELVAAWIETAAGESPGVWTSRFSGAGEPLGVPRYAGPASTNTWNLNAAVDDSGVLYVVYDAALGTRAKELQLARVDGEHVDRRALSADDGFDSVYPDIALQGGRVAITWFDARDGNNEIYLHVGSLAKLPPDLGVHAQRVTHTPGSSFGAYLAWNGSRLGLAWDDDIDGSAVLSEQSFDSTGTPLGRARRLTDGAARSLVPSIRRWRKGFAVAWNEYTPGDQGSGHGTPLASIAELQLLP